MSRTASSARWAASVGSFGVWALAVACAVLWGLRLSAPPVAAAVAPPAPAAVAPIDSRMVARALGVPEATAAPVVAAASRFLLQGVVAGQTKRGAALIGVDGQAARPFRVGAQVVPGYVLQSVSPRRAVLGPTDGGAVLTIDMPALR